MKKTCAILLFIALIVSSFAPVNAAAENWEDLMTQPDLQPGDLLAAGAPNGSGRFYIDSTNEYIYYHILDASLVSETCPIIASLCVGDLVECPEPFYLTYDDGTQIQSQRECFADGEYATLIPIKEKTQGRVEIFVRIKRIRGSDTEAFWKIFIRDLGYYHGGAALIFDGPGNSAPSRPDAQGSVYDLLVKDGDGISNYELKRPVREANAGSNVDPPTTEQPSSWAIEEVGRAANLNLVPLSLQSQYTQPITRAEYCALATALYERYTSSAIDGRTYFYDTDDLNVQKMAFIGVVKGVGINQFAPNDTLTREQAAVILARLAEALGDPLPDTPPSFTDNAQIADWAFAQVGQVRAAGIMEGVGDNLFAPQGPYTREQSILTILRLWDLFSGY